MYPFMFASQSSGGGGGEVFMAVGGSGNASTRVAYTTTSTDGENWTPQGPNISLPTLGVNATQYNVITYSQADSRFVMAGIQQFSFSPDGTTIDGLDISTRTLQGIGSGRGIYFANGGLNNNYSYAEPSGGGAAYWEGPYSITGAAISSIWQGYAYSPSLDRWVAASQRGELWTSEADQGLGVPQGGLGPAGWTRRLFGAENQRDVIWCDSIATFLAVGNSGEVRRSTDGSTWFLATVRPGTPILYGAAWSGSLAVVVGSGGSIWTSTDLNTWTARTSGTAQILYDVTYSTALSLFVACGASGLLLTSPDGVTWTSRTSGVPDDLYGITCMTEPD